MEKHHITGKIAESERYHGLHPLFPKAFAFLKRGDLPELKPGRYAIDGDRCWASVDEVDLADLSERKLEAHRRYIDIQAPITGPERIGLAVTDPAAELAPFDVEKDFGFFAGTPDPVDLEPGDFAIFFPPFGAHAPCGIVPGGPSRIKKVVVKLRVES